MNRPEIFEGDILLYSRVERRDWLSHEATALDEAVGDGIQHRHYYHVAVAIDSRNKIEAISGAAVTVNQLNHDESFDVFRPQCSITNIRRGLLEARRDLGQKYDVWLKMDDGLRRLTQGRFHMLEKSVYDKKRLANSCVKLLRVYLKGAKIHVHLPRNASPDDVAIAFTAYKVD